MKRHELVNYSKNIQQTVALPCYNGKRIGWLAMEGLCRQEPTPYDWELIICEEPHEGMLGMDFFYGYMNRLIQAGCNRVVYLAFKAKTPLWMKWQAAARAADEQSLSFVLQAIDDYSFNKRLELSQETIARGYDWMDTTQAYFYSIALDKVIIYNALKRNNVNIALATSKARQIKHTKKKRGIDGHIYKSANINNPCHLNKLFRGGVFTDGLNNISKRYRYYREVDAPFIATDMLLHDIGLPEDVADKLKAMAYG